MRNQKEAREDVGGSRWEWVDGQNGEHILEDRVDWAL